MEIKTIMSGNKTHLRMAMVFGLLIIMSIYLLMLNRLVPTIVGLLLIPISVIAICKLLLNYRHPKEIKIYVVEKGNIPDLERLPKERIQIHTDEVKLYFIKPEDETPYNDFKVFCSLKDYIN